MGRGVIGDPKGTGGFWDIRSRGMGYVRMLSSTWGSQTQLSTGQGLNDAVGAWGDALTITDHPEKRPLVTTTQVSMAEQDQSQDMGAPDTVQGSLVPLGGQLAGSALSIAAGLFCFFSSPFKGETQLDSGKKKKKE